MSVMCVPGLCPGMTQGLPGLRGSAASSRAADGGSGTARRQLLSLFIGMQGMPKGRNLPGCFFGMTIWGIPANEYRNRTR